MGFAYKYAQLEQSNRLYCSCILTQSDECFLPKINLLDMANCDGHSFSRLMFACCEEGRGAGEILR
jgi:hypothetical protein